jgi:hypothetical protein
LPGELDKKQINCPRLLLLGWADIACGSYHYILV